MTSLPPFDNIPLQHVTIRMKYENITEKRQTNKHGKPEYYRKHKPANVSNI